ncbi:tetratricopeptide repeat protein [Massilia sp. CMS3.1]|uniref:tetratricopeptide repeat protein n=1 Tax=Massilia sp. CMS3.1 TaxID=3373083 RepID=UPI003EE7F2BB
MAKHSKGAPAFRPANSTAARVSTLFAEGMAFHTNGQLDRALIAYEQVLRLMPKHFEALHHTGIIAFQGGNYQIAAGFIRSAIAISPNVASAHGNLGNALKELGNYDGALASYARALALAPKDADTHYNRGTALQALGRYDEALASFERAIALNPGDADALNNQAVVLHELRRNKEALAGLDQALALNPGFAHAQNNRGNVLKDLGRFEEALESYECALGCANAFGDAWYNRGIVLQALGRLEDALASYDNALGLNPASAAGWHNRALALQVLRRRPEALASCERALALQPDNPEILRHRSRLLVQLDMQGAALASLDQLGVQKPDDPKTLHLRAQTLRQLGQNEAALASIDQALALDPNRYEFLLTRGTLLRALLRYPEALACFQETQTQRPDAASSHTDCGIVLADLGQFEAASAAYDRALALDPDFALARWNRALLNLLLGDLAQGWQDYEARWHVEALGVFHEKRDLGAPLWLGVEPLDGKTILLHAEQGLGDALQFCRYASMVAEQGARVILEVQPALVSLAHSLPGVAQVVAKGDPLPQFDLQCPLMSLPLAFATRTDTIPAPAAYLAPDAARVAEWAALLGEKTRPRVGLVWSGNAYHRLDHFRSLSFSAIAGLVSDQYEFFSLQKELRTLDKVTLQMKRSVRHFGERLHDFEDTAALVAQMDLVITVDTSVAHLAGAMGKPVWILLAGGTLTDWRWLCDRPDSPWYPSARLYRQAVPGDWNAVLDKVRADLCAPVAN